MKRFTLAIVIISLVTLAILLSGCQGILSCVYDEPEDDCEGFDSNQIVVDASDWSEWHYIDLAKHSIVTMPVPTEESNASDGKSGIYRYVYDVFGEGIGKYDFLEYTPTEEQPEPGNWTFAVHRNNVRTNGGSVYETSYTSLFQLPAGGEWLHSLDYAEDEWNQTDVWTVQDKMLSGIIGNQGICVNNVLSGWLEMIIPPMPPTFSHNNHVFIMKLKDGSFAALQLADYMSASGTKCCLTINYKYPL